MTRSISDICSVMGDRVEELQKLLEQGADPNDKSSSILPIRSAARMGNYRQVEILIEAGARPDDAVDTALMTSVPGIYAIGDIIHGPMLAHKAAEDGVFAAEVIAGKIVPKIDYDTVPGVVYTSPEAASVGRSEESGRADIHPAGG